MKALLQITLALFVILPATTRAADPGSYVPPNGFVPDAKTAITIAVAVWTPIYGAKKIKSQRPYLATLHDGKWTVTGTLNPKWLGLKGGTAQAIISQKSGAILSVTHTK